MTPWLFVASFALAQDAPEVTSPPVEAAVSQDAPTEFPEGPEEDAVSALRVAPSPDLLAEARLRMLRADYEGVRLLTGNVLERGDTDDRDARYLTAMSWELGGDPARALALYDALLTDHPDHADARFRRAETLGRLGRYGEANEALATLGESWQGADRVQIAVLRALFDLEDGGSPRGPLRDLAAILAAATPEQAPGYQARARSELVRIAVEDADAIAFVGSDRKKRKQMETRAGLVAVATEQTLAVIALQAPEHVLGALMSLAHAHDSFGQAMLDESELRLSPEQRAIYEQDRAAKVEVLWIKAARYYERALEYAGSIGWTAPPVDAIRAARAALGPRIESLAVRTHEGG